ncbi:MAG: hypothetical protein U1F23_11380 [Lysobacterales bacterium]
MMRNILCAGALLLAMTCNVQAITIQDRINAATTTAEGDGVNTPPAADCAAIQPFWWEIGDNTALIAGDTSSNDGTATVPNEGTHMAIASASKWIYAAYVAERYGGALGGYDVQFMTMESGYHNMSACNWSGIATVDDCLAYVNSNGHTNGYRDPSAIGWFAYDGGHYEAHAGHLPGLPQQGAAGSYIDLGADNDSALTAEVDGVLGMNVVITYNQPLLAGGVESTPGLYATFLRAIMSGNLEMSSLLGMFRVCTNVTTCPNSLNTPVPGNESWDFSIGHWVEDDPNVGDNSYSNAGSRGFYAWIMKDKSYYGIIGKDVDPPQGKTDSTYMGWPSVECGRLIRKAWVTGQPQP